LTPGKRNFFVKSLSDLQRESLLSTRVAGVLLIRKLNESAVNAYVLEFNWKDVGDEAPGGEGSSPNYERLQRILGYLHHLGRPEEFVRVAKQYEISADKAQKLAYAGVNPYEELGFLKPK
jgi:formylmethanofuran dehydrogenase subunit E-like metal-binding protein